jgi:KDO2-lipid IV(A) lauroyltransferase
VSSGGVTEALRGRLVYGTYRTLGSAMQRLPEPVAEAGAFAVGLGLTAFAGGARRMYGRHLRRVLGADISPAEVRSWTRHAFVNSARYWLEGARLPAVPPEEVDRRMAVEGYENLVRGMAAGSGVIVALPHIGSWEWGGSWLSMKGYPMTAVVEPVDPPELFDWFVEQRRAMGLTVVPLGPSAMGTLLRTLRSGGVVGLLCDRDVSGNGIEVEFFGERTTLPAGPAILALRTGASLLPTAVYSGPGRSHTAVIQPPISTQRSSTMRRDVARVTQDLAGALQSLIRRAPEQWHLFQPNWPSDPGYLGKLSECATARATTRAEPG